MSREVWKAVETKAKKIGVAKTKKKGRKGRREKETRIERIKKERNKKESSKVRERSQEICSSKVPQMNPCL